jgi:hypothetical protein
MRTASRIFRAIANEEVHQKVFEATGRNDIIERALAFRRLMPCAADTRGRLERRAGTL